VVSDMGMGWAWSQAAWSFGQAPCRSSFQMTPAERAQAQANGARPHPPALVHVKRPRTTADTRETEGAWFAALSIYRSLNPAMQFRRF
jgi:hypothetical protein